MYTDKPIVISAKDWSEVKLDKEVFPNGRLPEDIDIATSFESSSIEQFGLYREKGVIRTSGFVGIQWLKANDGQNYIYTQNSISSPLVIEVKPNYQNLDQWEMLSCVLRDDEYPKYIGDDSERFYKIYYDEQPIVASHSSAGGELILVISFLKVLQSICRLRLKSIMSFKEENLHGNIRGTISFQKQIKDNIAHGREDRIVCKYPEFSMDSIENRILKKACNISGRILSEENINLPEVKTMYSFCKRALANVSDVNIKTSDFKRVNISGFNSCYKHPLELARLLITHCGFGYATETASKESKIIPYAIKMEALFEFYIRAKIREYIRTNFNMSQIRLADYLRPGDDGALTTYDSSAFNKQRPYIMHEYIPDILIQQKDNNNTNWKNIAVYDVKYQHSMSAVHKSTRRSNTHQLLSYTLLLNVDNCGFLFPQDIKDDKDKREDEDEKTYDISCDLILQEGNVSSPDRHYTQWQINIENTDKTFKKMFDYILSIEDNSTIS